MAMQRTVPQGTHDPVRHDVPMRRWTILAQDPGVLTSDGRALTTTVAVAAERLERGPKGHRIHVVDYDASANVLYRPRTGDVASDPYADVTDIERLVGDPHFHQQNVYAIAMATLKEFECALGRPVAWGFEHPGHQLKLAPHAFADANAYYSRESESLAFGYFPDRRGRIVYTCLSHDIVAHETTHALLDGLRPFYFQPSSPDQAAFHEGFADVVALLSVFRSQTVVEHALGPLTGRDGRVRFDRLDLDGLAGTALARLAEQMGAALDGVPSATLRASLRIEPAEFHYGSARFEEAHDRGELLVAIVMRAFVLTWLRRLEPLRADRVSGVSRSVVAEEGATAAKQLLRIVIRAIDYLPPVDMSFPDYLSALLTADLQLYPDDSRYHYRDILRETFAAYGVVPSSGTRSDGAWDPPRVDSFTLAGTHFARMQSDPTEVFRFVWENRKALGIEPNAFTRVISVRPVLRVSNDETLLRETVVEYVQTLKIFANELKALGIEKPADMPGTQFITLYGGGSLVFGEYGQLKFHIGTGVASARQGDRLRSLWEQGHFASSAPVAQRIAAMHRDRALRPFTPPAGRMW